jgi:hypothetical protein
VRRLIYIDTEFKCHTSNLDGTFREVQTDFFDGKCTAFIEGYRYVPPGERWTRSDGVVFWGEMITPWKPHSELYAAQREYERQLLAEYAEALKIVGVSV